MNETGDRASRATGTTAADEISVGAVLSILLRHWRLFVIVPLLAGCVVGARTLLESRRYVASALLLPSDIDTRRSQASALALQLGLGQAGGSAPGQSPAFYAGLLQSRAILKAVVETEYRMADPDGEPFTATLVDLVDAPENAIRPPWRTAMARLQNRLYVTPNSGTGTVRLEVSAEDADLAEQIATRMVDLLHQFNLETRQTQASAEVEFIEERLEDAQARLQNIEDSLQSFLQHNRRFRDSPELVFEFERMQRQVTAGQEVFTTLMQSYEQARIESVRDTPIFSVIEHPEGSAEPLARSTVARTLGAMILGGVAAIFLSFALDLARRSGGARGGDPELKRLARDVWDDMRRPARWFRLRTEGRPR